MKLVSSSVTLSSDLHGDQASLIPSTLSPWSYRCFISTVIRGFICDTNTRRFVITNNTGTERKAFLHLVTLQR